MIPSFVLVAQGETADEATVRAALHDVPGFTIKSLGEQRGVVSGTLNAVRFLVTLAGDLSKGVDNVMEVAGKLTRQGISLDFEYGPGKRLTVTNASRDQLALMLKTIMKLNDEAKKL